MGYNPSTKSEIRTFRASARVFSVCILDVDAHCGGGTYSLIKDTPGIIHVDVAVSPYDAYKPTGRSTLDIVRTANDYIPTVVRRLHALSDVAISVVIYNAGVDLYQGCDVGGMAGVTEQLLATREMMVFEWADRRRLPVAFVMAGGYVGARTLASGACQPASADDYRGGWPSRISARRSR